jgi:hypothetical protein
MHVTKPLSPSPCRIPQTVTAAIETGRCPTGGFQQRNQVIMAVGLSGSKALGLHRFWISSCIFTRVVGAWPACSRPYSGLMSASLLRQYAVTIVPVSLLDFYHRVHDKRA